MLKLEPRILFDGAALVEAGIVYDNNADQPLPVDSSTDSAQLPITDIPQEASAAPAPALVFIDPSIEDATSIADTAPGAEIIYLTSNDPWQQITDALANHPGTSAVHLLTHGSEQGIIIGSQTYGAADIDARSALFESWKNYLSSDADILIYGCRVGTDGAATALLASLANLTGADVAASRDDTGSAAQGGNWQLEATTGPIEAQTLAFPEYRYLLAEGFSTYNWSGVDTAADPLRMITWNVIGLDSNKPETDGPDTFMVGLRVNSNSAGLSGMTIKIVDDDGIDVFGTGIIFADSTTPTSDFDDGIDNIQFINNTEYRNVSINGTTAYSDGQGGYYRDFYFNVSVQRLLSSQGQIQPFHFEVFKDANADGVSDVGTSDPLYQKLDRFSWLPDSAAANTPLYLYVEKYISQARNDVANETYPDASASAIRVDGYTNTSGGYDASPLTIFIGQTLNIRTEGETATQGYPQLTVSTVFDTSIFQINRSLQYYTQPITTTTYQQELGTGSYTELSYIPFDYSGTATTSDFDATVGTANTSIYANPAGWNPATHSLMITSAPPKAGGDAIVTDYSVTVSGTGSGKLSTLILDYSGSSFHYNADLNSGVEGIDFVQFQAVKGSIVGTVKADTNGDGIGDTPIQGVTVTLTGTLDLNLDGDSNDPGETAVNTLTATTDANGNYVFTDLLPGLYTVTEGVAGGYGDVGDTDGSGNGKNVVQVVIGKDVNIGTASQLGLTGTTAVKDGGTSTLLAGDALGYQRADFVEGKPDLQLIKTANTLYPEKGGNVTFTLTVSNTSNVDAPYVQVTDKLPSGLTYLSDSSGGAYDSTTGVWTLGSGVTAGSNQSITVTARLDSAAAVSNFAEITAIKTGAGGSSLGDLDSTAGNNDGPDNTYGTSDDGSDHIPLEDDEARVTVESREADLSLIKTVSNSRPNLNDNIVFTLIVTNSGPDAATNIQVADLLPAGLSFVSATGDSSGADAGGGVWNIDAGETYNTTTGIWTLPTLANGASAKLLITAKVVGAAAIGNFAEIKAVDQYDPDSQASGATADTDRIPDQDDEAAVTVTPHASDLSLSKVVSDRAPNVGDNITYTLILTNSGPDAATNVVVTDSLPSGVTWVSGGTLSGSNVSWNAGSLAVGETKTLNIVVTVTSSGTLTNFAEVTASDLPDPDSTANNDGGAKTANEDDEAAVTITPGATDLSLAKSYVVDDGNLNAIGDSITFTLSVTNSGGKDAYHVRVKDLLPTGFSYTAASYSGTGTYDGTSGIWNAGTVAAGQTVSISFKATVTNLLAKTNFAEIVEADAASGDTAGDNVSTLADVDSSFNNDSGARTANEDDEALVTLPRIPYADLQLSNVISNATPGEGSSTTFTLTVTNTGVDDTTGVAVSFVFPDGTGASGQFADPSFSTLGSVSYSTATDSGTWTIGSLAYGQTATLVVTVNTPTGSGGNNWGSGDLEMFAQISASSLPDPDSTVGNYKGADNTLGTKDDGNLPPTRTYEDDEAIAIALSPTSSRLDVALNESVTVNSGAKTVASALVNGDTVVYTVTAYNQGGDANSAYVMVKWNAGLNLTSVSKASSTATNQGTIEYATDANGTAWSTTLPSNPTYIRWNIDNSSSAAKFDSGSNATLTLNGTVNATGAGQNVTVSSWFADLGTGSDVDSDSSVLGVTNGAASNDLSTDDLSDGVTDDDESSLTIGGNQSADLSLSKQLSVDGGQTWASSTGLYDGDTVTFRLSVSNSAGSDQATNISIADALPTGLVYRAQYGSGSYDNATGVWTLGTLKAGETRSIYIVADVDWDLTASSTLTNYAEVKTVDQPDPDSIKNNNSTTQDDDDSVTITEETANKADLSLTKTVSSTTPNVGSNVTFTLTVNNVGPLSATNVAVKDLLPTGLVYVSDNGGGSYDSSTGIWTVGTVASNGSRSLQIVARVASTDSVSNFAQITASDQPDPDSTVNNDSTNTDNEDDEAKVSLNPVSADLSLSKVVSNATPNVGDSITFTLTVVNGGPNTATGVQVTDVLPTGFLSGVVATSPTGNGSFNLGSGIWSLGDLAVGGIARLTITGTVAQATAITNFAEITYSGVGDADSTPNNDAGARTVSEDDEAAVSVTPVAADLQLSKAVDNATPNVGGNVTFTLSIVNAGPNAATNVVVTDYLPAGMTYVSNDGGATNSSGTISWAVGGVAVGEIKTLHIVATVNSASAISNFAQVTAVDQYDPDSTKNNNAGHTAVSEDDEAKVTVDAREADLSLSKSVNKAIPMLGDNVTFTITVSNASDDDATGVEITDLLPDGFTFVSASDSGSHSAGIGVNPDTIVWSGITVGAHASRSFTVVATATSPNSLSNVAQITASDLHDSDSTPNDGAGDDYATVAVDAQQADLSLTKSVVVTDKATADVDGYFKATFTITLNNAGPDAASNVSVKDALPAGLSILSATPSAGTFDATNGVWLLGSVASGSSPTLTIVTRVNSPAALTNTAWVATADQPDPDSTPGNNAGTDDKSDSLADDDEASANVNVTMVDLSLDKSINIQTPIVGDFVTYTITLTNRAGFDNATNIKVAETIPSGLDPATLIFTPSTGSYSSGEWTIGTLAGGTSATLTVYGQVTNLAALRNTAEITACDQFDIDSAPNNRVANPGEDDSATVAPGALATITGKVLDDRGGLLPNAFDANDTPISGVTVELWTDPNSDGDPSDGVLITSAQTDANGVYSLTAPAGNYVIVETDKSGYLSLRDLEAIDPLTGAITSDTTSPNNNRIPVTLVAGGEYYDRNFLDLQPWTISGKVLSDDTNDGLLDGANETGIDGSTVTLTQDTDGNGSYETTVGSVTTSGGGNYSFQAGPGRYRLVETNKSGYADVTDRDGTGSNTANQVDVVLQRTSTNPINRDFLDIASATGTISGHVYLDADRDGAAIGDVQDTNLAGVTVKLMNGAVEVATATTAADGSYSFTNIAPGSYTVVQTVPTNHSAVTDSDGATGGNNVAAVTLSASGTASADFLDIQNTGTISGHVYLDADRDNAAIGDTQDTNLAGVTVKLMNGAVEVATATTAADGSYSFTNIAPGSYTVVQTVPANHSAVTDSDGATGGNNVAAVTLSAGGTASADFLDIQNTGTISGHVYLDADRDNAAIGDTQDTNLAGVTVKLMNGAVEVATATTAADGSYSFTNIAPGSYTVVQTVPANHTAVTDSDGATGGNNVAAVTLSAGGTASADFLDIQNTGSISGHVYLDADRDNAAIGDTQDTSLAGVTVKLMNGAVEVATATTAADGSYSFTNIAPGSYTVVQTVPTNHSAVTDSDGATGGNNVAALTLSAGGTATADFLDIQNAADLVTVKTLDSGDATPGEGDTVTFLITVTNNGTSQATNISLTDSLPPGLTYTGDVASQGTYASGIWSIGTLNVGASVTLRLSGTVNAGTGGSTITNVTTKATSPDQVDPTDAGNDLSESVIVNAVTPPVAPAPLPLPITQPTPVSVPYLAPISLAPLSTQPEMSIALHVLPAVSDAREQTNGVGSDAGQIRSTTIGAGLGMDISLHVLPAVNDVAADVRSVEKSIRSLSFNSLNNQDGGTLLGYAPVLPSAPGEPSDSIARTFTEAARQQPSDARMNTRGTSETGDDTDDQQTPLTAPPSESSNPDDDSSKPIARKNFSDQLRQAASQRNAQRFMRGAAAQR